MTTETIHDQVKAFLINEDVKALSTKLKDYSLEHLEGFKNFVLEMEDHSTKEDKKDYEFFILHDNNLDPNQVATSTGKNYSNKDKYIYKKLDHLYASFNNIYDVYNGKSVKELSENIVWQLKKDDSLIWDLNFDNRKFLLQALK